MRLKAVLLFWVLLGGGLRAETLPTAEEVMAAALREPLATTLPAIQSYEAEVESIGLRANFWFTRPNRTALWVIDAQDGTPVMAIAGGTAAIYDALGSTVLMTTNLYGALKFSSKSSKEPGQSAVNFQFNLQSEPDQAVGEIQLPPKLESTNLRVEVKRLEGGLVEVRGGDTRTNPKTGETLSWTFLGRADWPAGKVPYRYLEVRGERLLNLTVRSVNEPIPESCFQFPRQAMLTSGLPIRQVSMEATNELSQLAGMLMANIQIRRALHLGDPQKAREAIREVCRSLGGVNAGQEVDKLYGDSRATEKMLAEMTPEQWEQTRTQLYADLSREEFEKRRLDPAFRKDLAEKIVAGMNRPMETEKGTGPPPKDFMKGMLASMEDFARKLDTLDIEALRAKDQKIAAQLRQAFQLEATAGK